MSEAHLEIGTGLAWDQRYASNPNYFGERASAFLIEHLSRLTQKRPSLRVLCLGEGEGRDALFLAQSGHQVTAMDYSLVALQRLKKQAHAQGVFIEVLHADLEHDDLPDTKFDLVTNFYCHLSPYHRRRIHRQAVKRLSPYGLFMVEGFNPLQKEREMNSGGPPNRDLLWSSFDLVADVEDLAEIHLAADIYKTIDYGKHQGPAHIAQILVSYRGEQ